MSKREKVSFFNKSKKVKKVLFPILQTVVPGIWGCPTPERGRFDTDEGRFQSPRVLVYDGFLGGDPTSTVNSCCKDKTWTGYSRTRVFTGVKTSTDVLSFCLTYVFRKTDFTRPLYSTNRVEAPTVESPETSTSLLPGV